MPGNNNSGRRTVMHDVCGGKLVSVYVPKTKSSDEKYWRPTKLNEELKVCLKCNKVVKLIIKQVTLK